VRADGAPWIVPGGPLVPIAACAANAWLIYATAAARDWIGIAIVVAASVLLYALRGVRLRIASKRVALREP
jgi:hypothetical protein